MNENHATDATRSDAISGNRRETNDVLVLPADNQKLGMGSGRRPRYCRGQGIQQLLLSLPFVNSRRGANDVSNFIGFEPCPQHDAKSTTADHRNVALQKKCCDQVNLSKNSFKLTSA